MNVIQNMVYTMYQVLIIIYVLKDYVANKNINSDNHKIQANV